MTFSLYGNDAPQARKFNMGDKVKRDSDGKTGVVIRDASGFQRKAGQAFWCTVQWDASGSKSDRVEDGLSLA